MLYYQFEPDIINSDAGNNIFDVKTIKIIHDRVIIKIYQNPKLIVSLTILV